MLPAVERILKAFGYRKEDLRYQKTKQVGLGAWLKVKGKKIRIRLLTKPERKLSWLLPPLSNN